MTGIVLVVGATSLAVLLAALFLDSVVSARGAQPAPRHFFLFLIFFLGLQVVSFALSAFTVESRAGFRLPSIPIFVLEDTMHAVSALLIWYVPRFLSVSFGLDYPRLKKRVFLGLLVLIGAAKIVTVNAQAFAYWSDSFDRLARVAFAVEDLAVMPVFYAWFVYLVASAARALRRSDAAHRKPYFWGPWFLFALAFLLLADLAERALADPFLADVTGTVPSPIVGFPFLSLAGLCMGLTVVLRAVASLRRTFAMATADAAPSRDDRLSGFGLTPRELEIARLLVRGRVNKEIAVALDISYGTVKNHAYSLYQKLHITSRFELIRLLEEKSPSEAQTP
jgi:DNA-binding CsgD family transcriptional regulator